MLPWERPLATLNTAKLEHYGYCFGCGRDNPIGLKLSFSWDGRTASTDFTPENKHQGWPEMMHGGLVCAILDEAIGWAAWYNGISGVTGKLEARIKQPIFVGQKVRVAAATIKTTRKLVKTGASIVLADGTIAAEATATIYVLPQNLCAARDQVSRA